MTTEHHPGDSSLPYGANVTAELRERGDKIGGFEIGQRLAVTLLGALYRVHVRPAGGVKLLHVLPKTLARDPNLRPRLEKRVGSLGKVTSEIILSPEEVVDFDDTIAIVYPDCNVRTLPAVRRDEPAKAPSSVSEVRTLLKQVALALEVGASVGAHHFGLSPDFLLLTPSGNPRLWGFGVLESIDRRQFEIFISSAIVPLKEQNAHAGYSIIAALSPEWRNDDPVDVRADLYALGVLAYDLLTRQRLPDEEVAPSKMRDDVPEGWDYFVRRLIETDPQLRYQTPAAVSTDLDRVERLGQAGVKTVDDRGALGRLYLPAALVSRMPRPVRTAVQVGGLLLILGLFLFGAFQVSKEIFGPGVSTVARPDVVAAGAEQTPNIVLHTSPPAATVEFLGEGGNRFSVSDGVLRLVGTKRDYSLEVSARGYRTAPLQFTLGDAAIEETIDLEVASANLRLRAPAGSRLDVRGADGQLTFLDNVPASGVLEIEDRLMPRAYSFVVSHPLYETTVFEDIPLEGDDWVDLSITPEPKRVPLEVVSSPPGADVQVNGVIVGRTPLVIDGVPVHQPVDLTVGGGIYRTWHTRVQPRVDEDNAIDAGSLELTDATLRSQVLLAGQPPSDEQWDQLTLEVGDEVFSGRSLAEVHHVAGNWPLRVEHPDYVAKVGEVTLVDRETTPLQVDLRPRPGTLHIVLPADREVVALVEGRRQLLTDEPLVLDALVPVQVSLQARDYLPVQETFTLDPNSDQLWQPHWEPLPGPSRGQSWQLPHLDGARFVWVPDGVFRMGSPKEEPMRRPNEGPLTTVRLTAGFWVGATEVTQASFTALMGTNPSRFRGADRPVDSVTWAEANAFCERLTERERAADRLPEGFVYRLPTEAEWEYVARAGTRTPFFFGEVAEGREEHFQGRYPRDYSLPDPPPGPAGSLPVGQFKPNPWGLYDVHGNVREWTLDEYNDRLPGGEQVDYRRRGEGRGQPVRGGSWSDLADRCRSAARDSVAPEVQQSFIGFRVVLAPFR